MTRFGMLALVAALVSGGATAAVAQTPGGQCILEASPIPGGNDSVATTAAVLPSGKYNVFQGGGVRYRCQGQDVTLDADSTEYYGDQAVLYLIGNVHYREPRAKIDADRMTYFQIEDRLVAEGNVFAVDARGSTMTGPRAELLRARPGRLQRLSADGRPTLVLIETDSLGQPEEPVDVVADRIVTDNDSLVYAGGAVRIGRPDFTSASDSAYLDSGHEFARLMGRPSIQGRGERPFTLSAQLIDLFSRNRQLDRVIATTAARVLSEDTELTSDSLDLRLAGNELQEVFAWGPGRAKATTPERTMIADSLHVVMPGQRIMRIDAVGEAYAETVPDSTKVRSTERDWLRGDTIVATFDSTVVADSAATASQDSTRPDSAKPVRVAGDSLATDTTARNRPLIRDLVATGHARSFYQMAPQAGGTGKPAVNYVRGRSITVDFRNQAVHTVTVADQAVGMYLEEERPDDRNRAGARPAQPPTQQPPEPEPLPEPPEPSTPPTATPPPPAERSP